MMHAEFGQAKAVASTQQAQRDAFQDAFLHAEFTIASHAEDKEHMIAQLRASQGSSNFFLRDEK